MSDNQDTKPSNISEAAQPEPVLDSLADIEVDVVAQPPVVENQEQPATPEPVTVTEVPDTTPAPQTETNLAEDVSAQADTPVEDVRRQNSEFAKPVFIPEFDENSPIRVSLPVDFSKEQGESLERIPTPTHVTTMKDRIWAQNAIDSADFQPADDVIREALERDGSEWRQEVPTEAGVIAGVFPRFKNAVGELSGDAAIMQLMQHRKLGAMYRMPLWNSGFWITFKAPSESSLLELHRSLTTDKVELGRRSYGLSYSHTTAIYMDRVSAFALEHLHSTNLKLEPGMRIRDYISSHDLNAIVIGLTSTIWPNGFNYARSCIADPDKCRNVVEEKISIPKTLLVDRTSLTNWQLTHMSKVQTGSVTAAEVKRYQEEMQRSQKRKVIFDEGLPSEVSMLLRVPTVTEYVEAGLRWITELTTMVDRSLNREISNDERNNHIINYGRTSSMRQYGHWVEEVEFGGKKLIDKDTVESALATLSSDDNLRIAFQKQIAKYQSHSTITVAAIPSFKCPACGQVNESSKYHPTITDAIPYDVFQTFFVVLVQKIQSISER